MARKWKSAEPAVAASNVSFEEELAFLRLYHKGDDASLVRDVFGRFQSSTYTALEPHFTKLENAIQIPAPNVRFREGVTKAVCGCMIGPFMNPDQIAKGRTTLKRMSQQLTVGARAMRAAIECFDELPSDLKHWFPREVRGRIVISAEYAETIAHAVSDYAKIVSPPSRGGRPRMWAFEALVRGLARVFHETVGRAATVTWNNHTARYGGMFCMLVEAALPIALELAAKKYFEHPDGPEARGQYIRRLLSTKARAVASNDARPADGQNPIR